MATKRKNKRSRATKKQPLVLASRFSLRQVVVFAMVFGVVGGVYLAVSHALTPPTVKPFVEDKARGLVWKGIRQGTGKCVQTYELFDRHGKPQGCTHGPDPASNGLNATESVEPLTTGVTTGLTTSASGIVCDGDGTSGYRVQMIYAHASDRTDRYSTYAGSFQQYAAVMNNIMVESSNQSGSTRYIRFVTSSDCSVSIPDVTLSSTGDDSFANTESELKAKGYSRSDRKYVVWTDATLYCGIGSVYVDSSPGQTNANNGAGPLYSRIDSGCWGGKAEAHELMHNLGAVQKDAPHTSGNLHCNDGYDRMCYADGGATSHYTTTACPSSADDAHYDCNKDDYFNSSSSIPSTNYLATHWNTANSRFLITSSSSTPPPPPPPSADTTLPVVSINSPTDGTIVKRKTSIAAAATDNVGVVKMQLYIDGVLLSTVSSSSLSYNWNASSASSGTHSILIKAYDGAGNIGQQTVTVVK